MSDVRKRLRKGAELIPENIEGVGGEDFTREGEIGLDSDDSRLKVRAESATRTVVTEDQTQEITNKTIDGTDATGTNTISADATDITYDNFTSGLTATDVQAAMDETDARLDQDIQDLADHEAETTGAHAASAISYDNSTSLLTATDTQAAIDEVEGRLDTAESNITTNATNHSDHLADPTDAHDASAISYDNSTSLLTATDTQAAIDEIEGRLDTAESNIAGKPNLTASNDNRIVRTDGTTALQDSGITIDDTNAISGVTSLDVGDARINSSGIQSIGGSQLNYSISTLTGEAHRFSPGIAIASSTNADQTGSDVILRISDTGAVSVTNAGLTSIVGIVNPESDGYNLTLTNQTGNDITIKNDGTVGAGESKIFTGTKKDLVLKDEASITLLYKNTLGFYVVGGTGADAGQGGINYILNSDAETGTDGWTTYADAAGTEPVDGDSGSPTITFTQTTSSPLRGDASFLWSKSASNLQGEGSSYDLIIDDADKGKILSISFDYNVGSNYVDGDVKIFVYDIDNSTLIRLPIEDLLAIDNSLNGTFRSYLQTAIDSNNYRLIIHQSSTSALAYDIKLDNVKLGPINSTNSGSFISDWIDFTPTGSWTINTTYEGKYRRVGDSAEIQYRISLGGAPNATPLLLDPPNNLTLDSSKILGDLSDNFTLGVSNINDTSGSDHPGFVRFNSGQLQPISQDTSSTFSRASAVTATSPVTFASGDTIIINTTVPIVGWGSGLSPNEILTGRSHYFHAVGSGTQSLTNNVTTKLTNWSIEEDYSGSWDSGSNRYIVPETGIYHIDAQVRVDDLTDNDMRTAIIFIYKNGSLLHANTGIAFNTSSNVSSIRASISKPLKLVKGDYIEIYCNQLNTDADTLTTSSSSPDINQNFTVYKINELSSQTYPTETVFAHYNSDSGQTVSDGQVVEFENKITDTHNAYNTTTGVYTVPITGKYYISTSILTNNAAASAVSEIFGVNIHVNGTRISDGRSAAKTTTSINHQAQAFIGVDLVAGDEVEIKVSETFTPSLTLTTIDEFNTFSIVKEGN